MGGDGELPHSVVRGIGDKLYEKRKCAALEVEQLVKSLAAAGNTKRVGQIIDKLIEDFAFSPQANYRKGGLLCLAATAVGLANKNQEFLQRIVPPVLNSFTDQDSRVRYYACEALYNIAKVAREGFMMFFHDVFDALFRLCADSEANVQNAAQFLDNLVKDIVTASYALDLDEFIPKLREYLTVVNPYKRQFLISWISVLASVPDIDMLQYLPELLEGLMGMLSDTNREIRQATGKALQEFLLEIQSSPNVEYGELADILVKEAQSADEVTRMTALRWLRAFVIQAKDQLMPYYAIILAAVLPNVSHNNQDICQVRALLIRSRQQVLGHLEVLLPALFDALSGPSDRVVLEALSVQATIAEEQPQFGQVMQQLLERFRGPLGGRLLQRRGSLILRKLSLLLGPQKVFCALADILNQERDLRFASAMVQALNVILLTAPEVKALRSLLAQATAAEAGADLFHSLYSSWSHSAGAVLSLCFLAGAYSHACDVITAYSHLPMGVEVLVQIDRLVQLLETPIFTYLRLQLLQPARYPDLIRCMYGLLMLLPQSDAFKTLHARLHSVPTMALLKLEGGLGPLQDIDLPSQGSLSPNKRSKASRQASQLSDAASKDSARSHAQLVDFEQLLQKFKERQEAHSAEEERRQASGNTPGGDGSELLSSTL
ncbi:MAG: VAC14 protein [Trebouxia sp. A1-2]|nr:MAG: VAC14 protein [Trebouxia sp. A1-2]